MAERMIPTRCNACGAVLALANLNVDDGCPCNSPRGVNLDPKPCVLCGTDDCVKPSHQAMFVQDALTAAESEVARLTRERDELAATFQRAHGVHHSWVAKVATLTRERDELQRHFDAAGPEHNLPALLDLYHGRMTVAEDDAKAARAARDTALAMADRMRAALADIARPWPRLAEVPTNDPDAAEYLRMALMGEQRTAREALGLEDSGDA